MNEIFAPFSTIDQFKDWLLGSDSLSMEDLESSIVGDEIVATTKPGLPDDLEFGARVVVKMNYGWVLGDVPMRGEGNQRKACLDRHPQYPNGTTVTLDNYEVRHF